MSTKAPMSTSSHETESASASASASLKSSPSKRDKVRKFLRRVSSIGHRRRQESEFSLDGAVAGDAQTHLTGVEGAEPHTLIDLTDEPEPIPVKVARRDSICSSGSSTGSALKPAPLRLATDDASSFHSSTASSSSDAHSVMSSRRASEEQKPAEPLHVEPEQTAETIVEEPAQADPAPAVFLDAKIPQVDSPVETAPIVSEQEEATSEVPKEESSETHAQAAHEDDDDCVIVDNPFSDSHKIAAEAIGSRSPDFGPTANDEVVEPMELDQPAVASPIATVGESPARLVEVTSHDETVAESNAVSPVDNTPYVVVHPATPIAKDAPAAPSSPSPPSSSSPSREVTLYSLFRSGVSLLRSLVPGKQTVSRWRGPICYTLMCICYTLTWYLRRPVPEVSVNRFMMY